MSTSGSPRVLKDDLSANCNRTPSMSENWTFAVSRSITKSLAVYPDRIWGMVRGLKGVIPSMHFFVSPVLSVLSVLFTSSPPAISADVGISLFLTVFLMWFCWWEAGKEVDTTKASERTITARKVVLEAILLESEVTFHYAHRARQAKVMYVGPYTKRPSTSDLYTYEIQKASNPGINLFGPISWFLIPVWANPNFEKKRNSHLQGKEISAWVTCNHVNSLKITSSDYSELMK